MVVNVDADELNQLIVDMGYLMDLASYNSDGGVFRDGALLKIRDLNNSLKTIKKLINIRKEADETNTNQP